MSETDSTSGPAAKFKRPLTGYFLRFVLNACLVLFIFLLLAGTCLGPIGHGRGFIYKMTRVQVARQIGLCMYSYSTDHNGNYPDGKSSTEVFQKLLDENYVSDPNIFYIPLAGKIAPVAGQHLKPENVCWDVTSGVGSDASDALPLVFMTSYKVTYTPGAGVVPLTKPYPPYGSNSWLTWLRWPHTMDETSPVPGIAVFYKGNNAMFRILDTTVNPDGTIPNFVPPDFDSKGKTYRQLTPDGTLPLK